MRSKSQLQRVYSILAYQFGLEVADCFKNYEDRMDFVLSSTGRIRDVLIDGKRILTLRPSIGLFTLTMESGEIIKRCTKSPRLRVIVNSEMAHLIKGSVLRPVVKDLDPTLRCGGEVLVVTESDELIGVGKLRIPPIVVKSIERGEVVRLRESRVKG